MDNLEGVRTPDRVLLSCGPSSVDPRDGSTEVMARGKTRI